MACKACVDKKMQELRYTDRFFNQIGLLTEEAALNLQDQQIKIMNEKCGECPSE